MSRSPARPFPPLVRQVSLELEIAYCVGGVISPLLANIYMNRFLKAWREGGKGERYHARIVNYADDFVILSRGEAEGALAWTRWAMGKLRLTLNETKTSIRNARRENFDFLGYTFGPQYLRTNGRWYLGAKPSKKSVARMRERIREVLRPGNQGAWPEVCARVNRIMRGWANYFSYGSKSQAYRAADEYVYHRVRQFLRRRHKVPSRGYRRFPAERVFGELGILKLAASKGASPPWALA